MDDKQLKPSSEILVGMIKQSYGTANIYEPKEKVIRIRKCAECPYFHKMYDGEICNFPNKQNWITDDSIIQKFCPITDN